MGSFFVYVCSGMCFLVYLPVLMMGVNQVLTRRVGVTLRLPNRQIPVALGGLPAFVFGLGQLFSGLAAVAGISLAIQNNNVIYLIAGAIIGAIIALIGFALAVRVFATTVGATMMQQGLEQMQNMAASQGFGVVSHPEDTDSPSEAVSEDDIIVVEEADLPAPARRQDDIIDAEYVEVEDTHEDEITDDDSAESAPPVL